MTYAMFTPEAGHRLLTRRRYEGEPWGPWSHVRLPDSRLTISPDSQPGIALTALLGTPLMEGVEKVTFKFAARKVQYKLLDKS